MADVATPSAVDMATSNIKPDRQETTEKPEKKRPEKPDEEKYKADLAKAEKEHSTSQEALVCLHRPRRALYNE